MPEARAASAVQEGSEAHARAIFFGGLAVLALIVLIGAGLWLLATRLQRWHAAGQPPATPIETATIAPPPPRLQVSPASDLAAFRAHEEAELHRLGWVDRQAGRARIPIEDAMRLLAAHGWPQTPEPPP
ncbi:hypothetical protein [Benzoatithermus flavus]|uniref:Uncharacterized protein n=1 Tax=Benzoatithermus flavus TaxID=3108223 RepID=A0ABU8XST2_9PROT